MIILDVSLTQNVIKRRKLYTHLLPPPTHQESKGNPWIISGKLLFLYSHWCSPVPSHPRYFYTILPIGDVALWGVCWGEASIIAAVASVADNLNWLPWGSSRGEAEEGTNCRGMMKKTRAHAGPDQNPRNKTLGCRSQPLFNLFFIFLIWKLDMQKQSVGITFKL